MIPQVRKQAKPVFPKQMVLEPDAAKNEPMYVGISAIYIGARLKTSFWLILLSCGEGGITTATR